MMLIKFSDGSDWYTPNWVFRQLTHDIINGLFNDGEVAFALEQAGSHGFLSFDARVDPVKAELAKAIISTIEKTLSGEIAGWKKTNPADHEGQRMYFEAIAELLEKSRRELEL